MSMLTGLEIQKLVEENKISIYPFNPSQLNPNSYNVRLHDTLVVYDEKVIDIRKENKTKELKIPETGLVLHPGKLYLGRTIECTQTPPQLDSDRDLIPCIDGRSSIARVGLSCHISAGFGDVGFEGTFTLEISVVEPVKIYPGIEIGQLYYYTTEGERGLSYNGRYQDQTDATPTRFSHKKTDNILINTEE